MDDRPFIALTIENRTGSIPDVSDPTTPRRNSHDARLPADKPLFASPTSGRMPR